MKPQWMLTAAATTAVVAVTLGLVGADQPAPSEPAAVIGGPYARLLSDANDLGPARGERVQLTAALNRAAEPVRLTRWADDRGLSVRWRDGDDWAILEGAPSAVADAFGVDVHDYRALSGPEPGRVFYASPQQPNVPAAARA